MLSVFTAFARHPFALPRLLLCALLCLMSLATLPGAAQAGSAPTSALRFKRLPSFDSSELSILALLQDRQGFVWIGTHSGGLYRYNGYHAVKYASNANSAGKLPHDRVSDLYEDAAGAIWVATQNGLARFNPETNNFTRFVPPPGPASQRIVKKIIGDGKGGMWLATWGGLQHFDPASARFTLHLHDAARPGSLASNDLNAIALDAGGGLWAATWPGGLDYLAPGARAFTHFRVDRPEAPDPKLNIVRALHFAPDQTLWIGTETGVVSWRAGQPWNTRRQVDSPATRINTLYGDRNDTVWAGTLGAGLLRWDKQPQRQEAPGAPAVHYVHRANDSYSLPSDDIRAVMHDRSGMLWIGSITDGISLVNLNSEGFQRFIPFDVEANNLRPNNAMRAMEGAPDGRLWLANNAGLSLFDSASGAVLRSYRADARAAPGTAAGAPGPALSSNIVYSLYQQPDGPLWIGTSAGLNRLDALDAPLRVVSFGSVGSDFINTIAPAAGGALWIGTGLHVLRYDPASGQSTPYPSDPARADSRSVSGTTSIVEDRLGRVWMGSEWGGGGLDVLDQASGRFRHLRQRAGDARSLSDNNVVSLYQDPQGRLWAGTARGVNQVMTDAAGAISFRRYDGPDSVGPLKILAMRSDRAGQLWLSSANGLLRLDPDSGKVARFSAADGLSEGFSSGAAHAAPDGRLYFGGVKAITGVSPQAVRSVSSPPQVAITDISVFNRSLRDGRAVPGLKLDGPVTAPSNLTLAGDGSVFSIEFAALHFTDPMRNTYEYRLDGFDRAWVQTDAAHRSATYTNLDPGSYTFSVRAANHQGVRSENAASMTVTILPPWWKTWWFRTILALLALGLLSAAYRARVRDLTRRQKQLQHMVAERTAELEASNAKLAALSSTDGLTGINNRRGFDHALDAEWRRGARNGYPVALAMLDVDHFKSYNDHYGHQAGDQCLRAVAGVIAAHARRPSDLVARYGGEEFALLAPATSVAEAHELACALCLALEQLALPHAKSPYGVVTISIGVVSLMPDENGAPEQLVEHADRAMYRAKTEGRNRALCA
ncbi:ligand-binding sensor domain-containing diguanylate cyclase [Massilia genomosp. 1]|uniref:diguanylate cyclase n=1 Tax=Massilia genomosp. 1 TaxID=2609280 RepID=A0ABX0MSK7_9BURK|nr:diguanylate cyclase [Massilia genomosp. 1]NHZ60834.1 diguanylate cyclase [Massilia genomosp. 1]